MEISFQPVNCLKHQQIVICQNNDYITFCIEGAYRTKKPSASPDKKSRKRSMQDKLAKTNEMNVRTKKSRRGRPGSVKSIKRSCSTEVSTVLSKTGNPQMSADSDNDFEAPVRHRIKKRGRPRIRGEYFLDNIC